MQLVLQRRITAELVRPGMFIELPRLGAVCQVAHVLPRLSWPAEHLIMLNVDHPKDGRLADTLKDGQFVFEYAVVREVKPTSRVVEDTDWFTTTADSNDDEGEIP